MLYTMKITNELFAFILNRLRIIDSVESTYVCTLMHNIEWF